MSSLRRTIARKMKFSKMNKLQRKLWTQTHDKKNRR